MSKGADLPPKYNRATLTEQQLELVDNLPFDELIFRKLFDFIEGLVGSYRLDEPLKFTQSFLARNNIQLEDHLHFFTAHGVSTDYEVVTVLEPKFPVDENAFERRKI